MKILHIITQADGGGAQKYTLTLAKHFEGAIAAGNEASRLFIDAQRVGLTTFELIHLKRNISPWHDFLAVWEIHKLIQKYKPDIVHLNSTKAGTLGSFASIGTKAKVVFTAHGFVFNEPLSAAVKSFYLALEKIASGYRDYIITVSDADKKSALDNYLIAADKISTIHNGLPEIKFVSKEQARQELGLDDKTIVIGNTSNFYKTKGLDILIDAVAIIYNRSLPPSPLLRQGYGGQARLRRTSHILRSAEPDEALAKSGRDGTLKFLLIGDGPEIENLKLKIKNLHLQNNIFLLGKKSEASKYLKAFDIFVLPSRKEGLPFALLEAMQAGLPIVASNVGGMPEALGDAGVLVEPENPQALADAIETVLADEQKRNLLSQKALERSKLFTEQKMLGETANVYSKLHPCSLPIYRPSAGLVPSPPS